MPTSVPALALHQLKLFLLPPPPPLPDAAGMEKLWQLLSVIDSKIVLEERGEKRQLGGRNCRKREGGVEVALSCGEERTRRKVEDTNREETVGKHSLLTFSVNETSQKADKWQTDSERVKENRGRDGNDEQRLRGRGREEREMEWYWQRKKDLQEGDSRCLRPHYKKRQRHWKAGRLHSSSRTSVYTNKAWGAVWVSVFMCVLVRTRFCIHLRLWMQMCCAFACVCTCVCVCVQGKHSYNCHTHAAKGGWEMWGRAAVYLKADPMLQSCKLDNCDPSKAEGKRNVELSTMALACVSVNGYFSRHVQAKKETVFVTTSVIWGDNAALSWTQQRCVWASLPLVYAAGDALSMEQSAGQLCWRKVKHRHGPRVALKQMLAPHADTPPPSPSHPNSHTNVLPVTVLRGAGVWSHSHDRLHRFLPPTKVHASGCRTILCILKPDRR